MVHLRYCLVSWRGTTLRSAVGTCSIVIPGLANVLTCEATRGMTAEGRATTGDGTKDGNGATSVAMGRAMARAATSAAGATDWQDGIMGEGGCATGGAMSRATRINEGRDRRSNKGRNRSSDGRKRSDGRRQNDGRRRSNRRRCCNGRALGRTTGTDICWVISWAVGRAMREAMSGSWRLR